MIGDTPQACTAEFTAALLRRDIGAALALLSDDVAFFYSNGSAIVGKDAFAALMTASWSTVENYKYESPESTWVTQTDAAAAVIYRFAWSGPARGNEVSGAAVARACSQGSPAVG
jgi:hypothetical protein